MAAKEVQLEKVGTVSLYKRRGANHVRISLTSTGQVRVTLPSWAPYQVGIEFAKAKADWILAQRKPARIIAEGQPIGKAHHVHFFVANRTKIMSRVHNNMILISLPGDVPFDSKEAQSVARKACVRALRAEAEQLLPRRLIELARHNGFEYRSVSIKQMKGRWGSCNQTKDIVLNCYLMQLPWELIDYVILHELTHTRIMAHGQPFWAEVGKYVHNLPAVRKSMHSHQPII